MLVELALKKTMQQQNDQTVAIKAGKKVQKDNIPGLDVSITIPVSVTVTEIINTVLSSIVDKSRSAEAAVDDLKTGMPATTHKQDSEIGINDGSFDCSIDEIPAMPIVGQDPENKYNDHSVTVAETVTVSTLSNASSESTPVDVRSNMSAIATRDSEIDINKINSESDIDETLTKSAAEECSKNHDDQQMNEVLKQKPEPRSK